MIKIEITIEEKDGQVMLAYLVPSAVATGPEAFVYNHVLDGLKAISDNLPGKHVHDFPKLENQ